MGYHRFRDITIEDMSERNIEALYDQGFVFTRLGRGVLHQVRSVRVRLAEFTPSSENRRALERSSEIFLEFFRLNQFSYHWSIGKLAKDFYKVKFGPDVMSANKIKELFSDPDRSSMNSVLVFTHAKTPVGYCLTFESPHLIHYSYPFYQHPGFDPKENKTLFNLNPPKIMGIAMLTKAVVWAKDNRKEFIYLGSIQDRRSLYKFQFKGIEWFDGNEWKQSKPRKEEI